MAQKSINKRCKNLGQGAISPHIRTCNAFAETLTSWVILLFRYNTTVAALRSIILIKGEQALESHGVVCDASIIEKLQLASET